MREFFQRYTSELHDVIQSLDMAVVETLALALQDARAAGRQVFIMGNGGSAAAASHWACDFGKGINVEGQPRLRVMSLTDNAAWWSAVANDISYDEVFVQQLKNWLKAGDLVIGLSVSGTSASVLQALEYAKSQKAICAAITGRGPNPMLDSADIQLAIPSTNYGIVEDIHMVLDHMVSQCLRELAGTAIKGGGEPTA